MLQAYPGRDPLKEILTGRITLRQFRIMVENLPPKGPVARALNGRWGDDDWMLFDISSRMRDLSAQLYNLFRGTSPPIEPAYLPKPEADSTEQPDMVLAEEKQMQDDLLKVLSRPNPH